MDSPIDSDETITRDLMRKLADDISAAMIRTLSLVSDGHLPITLSAGATCIGMVAGILNAKGGGKKGEKPDPECVLLAALLVAHTGIGGDDPIGNAYRDLEILMPGVIRS